MADAANPEMNQMLAAMMFGPQTQANLNAAQQQQALANAILQEGVTPISTQNRQVGNMGYAISPFEGLAKMAEIIAGKEGQQQANDALVKALTPATQGQTGGFDPMSGQQIGGSQAPTGAGMNFYDQNGNLTPLGFMQVASGNRAVAEMKPPNEVRTAQWALGGQAPGVIGQQLTNAANPGSVAMQTTAGNNAAGLLPPGTMPGGSGQQTPPPQPQQFDPMSGGPMQGQQQPPYGGNAAPQIPVQGPQALPPMPPQKPIAPPPGAPQFSNVPPSPQGAGAANVPLGNLPPVQMASLQPPPNMVPPQASPQPVAPPAASGPGTPPPNPRNYPNMNAYTAATEAWKAGQVEQAKVGPAGATTEAQDTGKNLADATKTFNVAASNLPRAMQRFSQLRDAAANASYGGGVDEEDPGSHFGDYSRNLARSWIGQQIEPKTAVANQVIDQATKQGVIAELGPQLSGMKPNRFLDGLASGASGLNAADPPPAKINAINGLQDQYISNLKAVAQQRRQYGDLSAPSDMDLAKMISQNADPSTTVSVISPDGKLGRVSPLHLTDLIQAGGQIR